MLKMALRGEQGEPRLGCCVPRLGQATRLTLASRLTRTGGPCFRTRYDRPGKFLGSKRRYPMAPFFSSRPDTVCHETPHRETALLLMNREAALTRTRRSAFDSRLPKTTRRRLHATDNLLSHHDPCLRSQAIYRSHGVPTRHEIPFRHQISCSIDSAALLVKRVV